MFQFSKFVLNARVKGKPPKASFPGATSYHLSKTRLTPMWPNCLIWLDIPTICVILCQTTKVGADCRGSLLQCWYDLKSKCDSPAYPSPLLSGQGVQQNFEVDKGSPTFFFSGPVVLFFRYPSPQNLLSSFFPNKALAPEYHSKMQNYNKT